MTGYPDDGAFQAGSGWSVAPAEPEWPHDEGAYVVETSEWDADASPRAGSAQDIDAVPVGQWHSLSEDLGEPEAIQWLDAPGETEQIHWLDEGSPVDPEPVSDAVFTHDSWPNPEPDDVITREADPAIDQLGDLTPLSLTPRCLVIAIGAGEAHSAPEQEILRLVGAQPRTLAALAVSLALPLERVVADVQALQQRAEVQVLDPLASRVAGTSPESALAWRSVLEGALHGIRAR